MKGSNNLLKRVIAWLTPLRGLAIGLFSAAILVSLIGYFVDRGIWQVADWLQELILGYYANVSVEFGSIVLTILVIDSLNEKRTTAREKHRLILQMSSQNADYASEAVRIHRLEGWLTDGTLKSANLREANLSAAELWNADLSGAILVNANLSLANLRHANLQGSSLRRVNLSEANLSMADLREANLAVADLSAADLNLANMQGANLELTVLENAQMPGVNLRNTKNLQYQRLLTTATLRGAILPDGTNLPTDDTWLAELKDWCDQIQTDKRGYIVL